MNPEDLTPCLPGFSQAISPGHSQYTESVIETTENIETAETGEIIDKQPHLELPRGTEHAIESTLPTSDTPNEIDRCLFELGRHVKAMEVQRGTLFTQAEHTAIVMQWYERLPHKNPDLVPEDYLAEYTVKLPKIKIPAGDDPVGQVFLRAQVAASPDEAKAHTSNPEFLSLASFMREMQRLDPDDQFYVSAEKIQELWNLPSAMTAWRRLKLLEAWGLIVPTEKARFGKRRANRYKYLGNLD